MMPVSDLKYKLFIEELEEEVKNRPPARRLTLEEISPTWYNILMQIHRKTPEELREIERKNGLDCGWECCVVGEAHGFDDAYNRQKFCGECVKFGTEFMNYIPSSPTFQTNAGKDPDPIGTIHAFEDHWNDAHVPKELERGVSIIQ